MNPNTLLLESTGHAGGREIQRVPLRDRQKTLKLNGLRSGEAGGLSGEWSCGQRNGRTELACGEGIYGAEAAIELGIGQAALAIESAEKVLGADHPFRGIAFHASGDKVAVRIASRANARHDMIEAPHARAELAQTIKAEAAFAGMNGLPQRLILKEIGLFQVTVPRETG